MPVIQGAITILLFVVILCGLVLVHELGHFVVARLFGMRVHEFGIGFPPRAKVLSDRGETIYTLNWLPIGGFVRLEGEDGDSDDPRSFAVAALPKKLLVLLAGVVMNLLVAFVIFTAIAWFATPQGGLTLHEVVAGSPAANAGLHSGETILAIDGSTFDLLPSPQAGQDAIDALRNRAGQTVTLLVRAVGGAERDVTVTLRPPDVAATQGALGIRSAGLVFTGAYAGRDPVAAVQAGAAWTVSAFRLIVDGLASLVSSVASNPTQAPPVSGPVGIAGLLSANLALVNILPFPPLDGGRMLVILLRSLFARGGAVLRRAGFRGIGPSAETAVSIERLTYLVGFVFLFGFLIWITVFDVARQVTGGTP